MKLFSKFKELNKVSKIKFIIVTLIIVIFLFLGIFADIIFGGTAFAAIIANSIGKFFNILKFFSDHYVDLIESLAIIVFMWIIVVLLRGLITILSRKGHRSETVGNLLKSIIKYGSVVIALFLILSAWGVQTPTLLASAGILGLALSFGAQSLIEDVIAGLFIIFESQFELGDVVQIHDFRGTVIELGIRTTKFEDINGDIKILNNSDIRGAINTSSHLSPAICDVSISYGEDLLKVEEIIKANLNRIKTNIPDISEGPYYRGVQSLAESSVVIRIYAKAFESKKYQVVRDLNRQMKLIFDENKIKIPFPQIVVHNGDKEAPKS
jgi:small-conductance mechanosensitive channel